MSAARYYTVGAIAPDLETLKRLDERVWEAEPYAFVVFGRRRDVRLLKATLPEARVRKVEKSLSRMQWFEFSGMYLGVSAATLLMGAVHLATGLVVQAAFTLACIGGLVLYYRSSRLENKLLGMGLPEQMAGEWNKSFESGFAFALLTVPEEAYEEAQDAFEETGMETPLAIDRRPVL